VNRPSQTLSFSVLRAFPFAFESTSPALSNAFAGEKRVFGGRFEGEDKLTFAVVCFLFSLHIPLLVCFQFGGFQSISVQTLTPT
jgi:hypothetical protein